MKAIYKVEYRNTEDKTRAYDEFFSSLKKAKERVEFMAWVQGVDVSFDKIGKSFIYVEKEKGTNINTEDVEPWPTFPGWIERIELN